MELVRTGIFALILLCKLCHAELPKTWYAANGIPDDDYSPKPISDIFTAGPPFSSANPIIVQSSTSDASTPFFSTSTFGVSTSSVYPPSVSTLSTYGVSTPATTLLSSPSIFTNPQTMKDTTFSTPSFTTLSPSTPLSSTPSTVLFQDTASPFTPPQVSFQPELIDQRIPPEVKLVPGNPQGNFPYLVIYQNAPQMILNQTGSNAISTSAPVTFTTRAPIVSESQLSTLPSTISSSSPRPNTISWNPTSTTGSLNLLTSPFQALQPKDPEIKKFVRIRMVVPKGSLTKIDVDTSAQVTTRKMTTTKRTTTIRPKKAKRSGNSYDRCINACDRRKSPICASPLSTPVDPDTLKGFPSICHMACHNSFKKNQYEMLVDGRCGKLRTRIRPIDSNSKLNRQELNKAQYSIVNNDPHTVVEFSSPRK